MSLARSRMLLREAGLIPEPPHLKNPHNRDIETVRLQRSATSAAMDARFGGYRGLLNRSFVESNPGAPSTVKMNLVHAVVDEAGGLPSIPADAISHTSSPIDAQVEASMARARPQGAADYPKGKGLDRKLADGASRNTNADDGDTLLAGSPQSLIDVPAGLDRDLQAPVVDHGGEAVVQAAGRAFTTERAATATKAESRRPAGQPAEAEAMAAEAAAKAAEEEAFKVAFSPKSFTWCGQDDVEQLRGSLAAGDALVARAVEAHKRRRAASRQAREASVLQGAG